MLGIQEADYPAISVIYQQGIDTGMATFETSVPQWSDWDRSHLTHSRLRAVSETETVGWAALSPVSSRCVYGGVAELSVYVHENHRGYGIGRALLERLVIESESHGIWTLQAGVMRGNTASIRIHEQSGFRQIGFRQKIGQLNGQWLDNVLLERRSKVVGV